MVAQTLAGREVALTGRLASMTRDAAVHAIETAGGRYVTSPGERTHLLVVGQDGWPLRTDGHLTRNLQAAQRLQADGAAIRVVSESEFLSALGRGADGDGDGDEVERLYTTEQLSRMLDVPTATIRTWVRTGLIRPARRIRRLCLFDFRQVKSAKGLAQLLRDGATPAAVRKSLERLRAWLPLAAGDPLDQLARLEGNGTLLVRLDDGRLAEPNGQLVLDFATANDDGAAEEFDAPPANVRSLRDRPRPEPTTPDGWLRRGLELEDEGSFEDAADAYHRALLTGGPRAELAFNLGNVLHRVDRRAEASQRFMQAVELEPDYVEAWNNLGNVLAELGRGDEAVRAYERALDVEPTYADAHFNLAATFEQLDRDADARRHWETYLRHNPQSPDAALVRDRLSALRT